MKKSGIFFPALLVPLDFIALIAAGVAAYYIRFHKAFVNIRPVQFELGIEEYTRLVILVAIAWILIFALIGLYSARARGFGNEIKNIFFACSTGMVVVFAALFFSRELFESRFIVLAAWIISIVFVSLERSSVRGLQKALRTIGVGVQKIVLIGKTDASERLEKEFLKNKRHGFNVVAHFQHFDQNAKEEIVRLKRKGAVDEIIFADANASREELAQAKAFSDIEHLGFKYTADMLSASAPRIEMHAYAGIPVMSVRKTPLDGWGAFLKRLFDMAASIILIIILSPILVLTALAILIESGKPMIYKNERVGEKGSLFYTFKFRSMRKEFTIGNQKGLGDQKQAIQLERELIKKRSNKQGPLYKITNDPRVTTFGRFIRAYSIDELPQLFNVFFGSMSLVGPRPHQPREVEKYEPAQRRVLTIRPGITGLSQISGRSDLDFNEEVRLDTYYIENWSLLKDISILLKTPLVVLKRKGAY
ncbi:MAG: undecaprenyl-phosphate glucose phosphotransferase [uncultured bacterium]|nr:MAG: undecaprenyl-phosphate glucose phosphotransferase [uncultured bacterium]HBD05312.1 hypothetical protein [Candidatus Uhrbacteria bacterium]